MILNPVIQGGGAEKVYKITNQNANYIFQEHATAGEIVISKNEKKTHRHFMGCAHQMADISRI